MLAAIAEIKGKEKELPRKRKGRKGKRENRAEKVGQQSRERHMNEKGGERTRTIHLSRENKSKIATNSCETGGSSPNIGCKGPCPPSGEPGVFALKSNQTVNEIMSNFSVHSDCRGYMIRKLKPTYTT